MSKNDKARRTSYGYDPFELRIIGGKTCPEGGGPNDTDDGAEHPLYDPRVLKPLAESDVEDVQERGILQPIRVRRNGDFVEVVVGRGRVRRAREVSRRTKGKIVPEVPALFATGKDSDLFGMILAENEHRDDDEFEARAEKVRRFMAMGVTEEKIALAMKLTVPGVKNYLAFFDLDTAVQTAIRTGEISPTAAIKLKSLERAEQVTALEGLKAEAHTNGHARIKVGAATQRAKVKSGRTNIVTERPGVRVLKKVIAHEGADALPDGFVAAVRWIIGDLPPEKVKGLQRILHDYGH